MAERVIEKAIRLAKANRSWSEAQLKRELGYSDGRFGNWKRRGDMPPAEHKRMADALRVTVDELTDGTTHDLKTRVNPEPVDLSASFTKPYSIGGPAVPTIKKVPVVVTARLDSDGFWTGFKFPSGIGELYVGHPTNDPHAYALLVKGDSLRPRYKPGEYIIAEPSGQAEPGDEVAVHLADERVIVKIFDWSRDGLVQFSSVNEDQKPVTCERANVTAMHRVVGRAKNAYHAAETAE